MRGANLMDRNLEAFQHTRGLMVAFLRDILTLVIPLIALIAIGILFNNWLVVVVLAIPLIVVQLFRMVYHGFKALQSDDKKPE
jgi:hypothetical protein